MHPIALMEGLRKDVPYGTPETQSSIAHRHNRRAHPTALEIPQSSFRPALGRLPVAVGDGHQFLRTIDPGSDHHQAAQTVVRTEPHRGVDTIHADAPT